MLRRAQMIGASMWLAYGVLIQALPVIGANLLVLAAAALTAHRAAKVGIDRVAEAGAQAAKDR